MSRPLIVKASVWKRIIAEAARVSLTADPSSSRPLLVEYSSSTVTVSVVTDVVSARWRFTPLCSRGVRPGWTLLDPDQAQRYLRALPPAGGSGEYTITPHRWGLRVEDLYQTFRRGLLDPVPYRAMVHDRFSLESAGDHDGTMLISPRWVNLAARCLAAGVDHRAEGAIIGSARDAREQLVWAWELPHTLVTLDPRNGWSHHG